MSDNVCKRDSAVHGVGIFAGKQFAATQIIFTESGESLVSCKKQEFRLDDGRVVNVNMAWALVVHLLSSQCEKPRWFSDLCRNSEFSKSLLREDDEKKFMLQIIKKYPDAKVLDVFTAVVTNYFREPDVDEFYGGTCLTERGSCINHSSTKANVACATTQDGDGLINAQHWVAIQQIERGEELFMDYGIECASMMGIVD